VCPDRGSSIGVAEFNEPAFPVTDNGLVRNVVAAIAKPIVMEVIRKRRERFMSVLLTMSDEQEHLWSADLSR
jgi:hypothetical protein